MAKKAIIDVVKYNGSPNVFAWKFPETALATWSQLIVNESQEAFLFKNGQVYDVFGPGRHTLTTENIPILNRFINLPFGGRSPFTAEVWFINKQHSLDIKWGTPTPIQLKDPKYSIMIPVRAFGQFGITIEDSRIFISKLVGTLPSFASEDIINFFRGMYLTKVRTVISQYISKKEISILEINAYLLELSDNLRESINSRLRDEYGIRLLSFFVNDISIPEDDAGVVQLKAALAKRAEMDIKGFDYTQERSFDTLQSAASNQGQAGNVMGAGIGMGMGFGMGGAMGQGMSDLSQNIKTSTKNCQECNSAMRENVRFCGSCGHDTNLVAEATLMTTCKCGNDYSEEYKFCPKCGTSAPVQTVCISCNEALKEFAKFCHQCGASQEVQTHKKCPRCSADCVIDAKFCMSCGTEIARPTQQAQPRQQSLRNEPAGYNTDLVDVMLINAGAKKIAVIKKIQVITGLGLKESKILVDSTPAFISHQVSYDEAELIKIEIEAAGGTVQLMVTNRLINNHESGLVDIRLVNAGSDKISIIKEVRKITGFELGKSKAVVDAVPSLIKSQIPTNEAELIKMRLEKLGGIVEIV